MPDNSIPKGLHAAGGVPLDIAGEPRRGESPWSRVRRTVAVVVGTRPEAIKLAPLVLALDESPTLRPFVLATAQHRQLLDEALGVFRIAPDRDLDLMLAGQSPAQLTARALSGVSAVIEEIAPAAVVVQGDTCTTLAGAMAGFYAQVPVAHVEAGLRTDDPLLPFPEEMNRRLVTRMARWHFAPTARAADALLAEGVPAEHVFVTGNTVVDALKQILGRRQFGEGAAHRVPSRPVIVATLHRRENWGDPFAGIAGALRRIAASGAAEVVFVAHANPDLQLLARKELEGQPGVRVVGPQPYPDFVSLLASSSLVVTDSGGIQEEACYLQRRVVILRESTERPEAVASGWARIAGTDPERVFQTIAEELANPLPTVAADAEPFGDGRSAARIVERLERDLAGRAAAPAPEPGFCSRSSRRRRAHCAAD